MLEYLGTYFDYIAANPRFPRVVQSEWMRSGGQGSAPMQRVAKEYFCPIFGKLIEVSREMIGLVRVGSVEGWDRLIAAVEEALHLGVTDAAAVLHIFHMPDAEQRRQYAITLAEELAQFERPMPVMDDYDLLLAGTRGGTQ